MKIYPKESAMNTIAITRSLSENRNRTEGKLGLGLFFAFFRRIITLFDEKKRKIAQIQLFCNRLSILGQATKLSLILLVVSSSLFAADGMITIKSKHSVNETVSRFQQLLEKKGMTLFATINHQKGAENTAQKLRPTTVVIFGNPKVGTPLMHCSQTIAIDLPQKALIFEDATGDVWYAYNDPSYLASRHGVSECGKVLAKIKGALANFAKAATQ